MNDSYLDGLLDELVPAEPMERWADVVRRARRSQRRYTLLVVAIAALVLAPATWAAIRAFEGTPAPHQIAEGFTANNQIAGTEVETYFSSHWQQVDASKAHGVLEMKTPDGPEDLWAAPAGNGTQCFIIDFANDLDPNTHTGYGVLNACEQSPSPPSNLDFSEAWFSGRHPDLMTAFGSVYVSAATVQLTLDDGATVTVPVVENLFIGSLPRGAKVVEATAFNSDGTEVARETHARFMDLPDAVGATGSAGPAG